MGEKRGPKTKHVADKIDVEQLIKLAQMQCTMQEIADWFECSVDTLERNFAETIKRAQSKGKVSVKRSLFNKAEQGDLGAIIWFSKNFMGMSDKAEVTNENQIKIVIDKDDEKL